MKGRTYRYWHPYRGTARESARVRLHGDPTAPSLIQKLERRADSSLSNRVAFARADIATAASVIVFVINLSPRSLSRSKSARCPTAMASIELFSVSSLVT